MSGRTFLCQDWITIRSSLNQPFTQDPVMWLDLDSFGDATCWIDVTEVTPPAARASLQFAMETSPSPDDNYFSAMAPPLSFGAGTPFVQAASTPNVIRSAKSLTCNNLMRYLRWKITPSTTGPWDLTFRIRVVANRSTAFVPSLIPGCVLWLRSDIGVALSPGTSNVTTWSDQSGSGADATAATNPTYVQGGTNGFPAVRVASGASMGGTFASSVTTHTLFAVLGYPALSNKAAFAGTDAANNVNSGFAQFTETPTGIIGRAGTAGSFGSAVSVDTSSLGSTGIYSTAADSNSTVDLFINGVSKASASTAGITLGSCPKYLLFRLDSTGSYPFVGDAYEYILFNNVLSASARTRVHRYLGARYGIVVP